MTNPERILSVAVVIVLQAVLALAKDIMVSCKQNAGILGLNMVARR